MLLLIKTQIIVWFPELVSFVLKTLILIVRAFLNIWSCSFKHLINDDLHVWPVLWKYQLIESPLCCWICFNVVCQYLLKFFQTLRIFEVSILVSVLVSFAFFYQIVTQLKFVYEKFRHQLFVDCLQCDQRSQVLGSFQLV